MVFMEMACQNVSRRTKNARRIVQQTENGLWSCRN